MPSTAAFRDLLIFEERLKQNAARLKNRKQKYQGVSSVTYANSFPRVLGHVYFVYVYTVLRASSEVGEVAASRAH